MKIWALADMVPRTPNAIEFVGVVQTLLTQGVSRSNSAGVLLSRGMPACIVASI